MTPRLSVLLLLLLSLAAVSVLAQRRRQSSSSAATTSGTGSGNSEWNYRDGCERLHDSLSFLYPGSKVKFRAHCCEVTAGTGP